MIRKLNEREDSRKENLKDGVGYIDFKQIATSEELFNKIKMYSTLTINPGSSIGYHSHVGEEEIMLINNILGLIFKVNNEKMNSRFYYITRKYYT